EIVALGQHLCADKDIDLVVLHALPHLLERPPTAGGVPVNPQYPRSRKQLRQSVLDALSALARRGKVQVAAARASAGHELFVPAVVAAQARGTQMEHQARRAARAWRAPATGEAQQCRGVSA